MASVRQVAVPINRHSAFRIHYDDCHDGVRSKPDRDNAQGIYVFIFPLGAGSFNVGKADRDVGGGISPVG